MRKKNKSKTEDIQQDQRLDEPFKKYSKSIICHSFDYVKDYHTAEDICQESFLRLLKNIDKVPPEKTKMWLYRTATNLSLDYLKKGGKYETIVGLTDYDETNIFDEYMDLSNEIARKETCEEKERVINRLKEEKPEWYKAILLCHMEGMDNSSIGEAMGVKPSLISKWKERGSRWLREMYKKEGGV